MTVRLAMQSDSEAISALNVELGYEPSEQLVATRLDRLQHDPEHAVYVFEDSMCGIVGWLHVHATHRIESETFAEIGGLVVAAASRRVGVGTQLVTTAAEWSASMNYGKLRVRCNALRAEALAFYTAIGFTPSKQQQILDRLL